MGDNLPRFPAPFLELLRQYVPWDDVLSLTSVDKREAPMRAWLINEFGEISHSSKALPYILAKYPRVGLRHSAYRPYIMPTSFADRVTNLMLHQDRDIPRQDSVIHMMTRLRRLDVENVWLSGISETVTHVTVRALDLRTLKLPPRTTTLRAFGCTGELDAGQCPTTLRKLMLEFGTFANMCAPDSVTHLRLGNAVAIPHRLPSGIVSLVYGYDGRASQLPAAPSLERLTIGVLDIDRLPWNLTSLQVYTAPLGGVAWPATLRRLVIGGATTWARDQVTLPPALEVLHVWNGFPLPLHAVHLPQSLVDLRIGELHATNMGDVAWPPRLARLDLPAVRPRRHNYTGVAWPASLVRAFLQDRVCSAIDLPPGLIRLAITLGVECALKWPTSLRRLRVLNYDFGPSPRETSLTEKVIALGCPPGVQCLMVGSGRCDPGTGIPQLGPCGDPDCCFAGNSGGWWKEKHFTEWWTPQD